MVSSALHPSFTRGAAAFSGRDNEAISASALARARFRGTAVVGVVVAVVVARGGSASLDFRFVTRGAPSARIMEPASEEKPPASLPLPPLPVHRMFAATTALNSRNLRSILRPAVPRRDARRALFAFRPLERLQRRPERERRESGNTEGDGGWAGDSGNSWEMMDSRGCGRRAPLAKSGEVKGRDAAREYALR